MNSGRSSHSRHTEQQYVPADDTARTGENAMGEAQSVSLSSNPRLKLFAVCINFLVISELFVAMYFASQTPERLTPVFFKIFFGLLAPTLVLAFIGRRKLAKAPQ